jgi:hypothetical protein
MAAATKKKRKEDAYPWKAGTSSGHITNLEQSILETFNIYGMNVCHKRGIGRPNVIKLCHAGNLQIFIIS